MRTHFRAFSTLGVLVIVVFAAGWMAAHRLVHADVPGAGGTAAALLGPAAQIAATIFFTVDRTARPIQHYAAAVAVSRAGLAVDVRERREPS